MIKVEIKKRDFNAIVKEKQLERWIEPTSEKRIFNYVDSNFKTVCQSEKDWDKSRAKYYVYV